MADDIKMLTRRVGNSEIKLILDGVVYQEVDAIVNAANKTLLGGGGVDGAIHRAAGPELKEACKKLNGADTGEAKITKSFNLTTSSYIIHTVGPVYGSCPDVAELLASCYKNSLDLAKENGLTSIAFPCISTGVYGYPLDEAARIAMGAIGNWLAEYQGPAMEVRVCCFKPEEFESYQPYFS